MKRTTRLALVVSLCVAVVIGCGRSSAPAGDAAAKWFGGTNAPPQELEQAAKQYYAPATANYFADMDFAVSEKGGSPGPLVLSGEEIKGRNAWVMWTGGNLKPNNYLYHILDAQLPGTIDTSLVA